jgi:hypothetical protein
MKYVFYLLDIQKHGQDLHISEDYINILFVITINQKSTFESCWNYFCIYKEIGLLGL